MDYIEHLPQADQDLLNAIDTLDLEGMKLAIAAGANVNIYVEKLNTTPLFQLFRHGFSDGELVKQALVLLLNAGADVNMSSLTNSEGFSVLHSAAISHPHAVVRMLLACGADENKDNDSDGLPGYVESLDDEGIDRIYPNTDWRENREFLNKLRAGKEERPKPEEFAELGLDMNARNAALVKCLFDAIDRGDVKDIKAALAAGADVNARDGVVFDTPLLRAVFPTTYRHAQREKNQSVDFPVEGIVALLNAGADVNAASLQYTKDSVLHWAAKYCPLSVVQLLIALGADEHKEQGDGCKPGQPDVPNFEDRILNFHADYRETAEFLDKLRAGEVEHPKPEEFSALGLDMNARNAALKNSPTGTKVLPSGAKSTPLIAGSGLYV